MREARRNGIVGRLVSRVSLTFTHELVGLPFSLKSFDLFLSVHVAVIDGAMASRQTFTRAVTPSWEMPDIFKRQTAHDASYPQVKTEEDYNLDRSDDETLFRAPQTFRREQLKQFFAQSGRRILFGALGLLALLILAANITLPRHGKVLLSLDRADHKLYLFVPSSNEPDLGYCRTELTAGILGYPTPYILPQDANSREQERDKVRNMNDHLNSLGEDHDGDLVIMLESPHAWFQLRPEVLVKRYYEIIERADKRMEKRMTGDAEPPTQRIVFAAQNHCSGHTLDELPCFAPPDNPVDKSSTLRYINAGLAIGPVKDMRRLFNRLNGKAVARNGQKISQQGLLAEVFGEQEFRREFVRQGALSNNRKKLESVLKALGYSKPAITDTVPGRQLIDNPEKSDYEMSIGLDYANELGFSITRQADFASVDWIRHDSSSKKKLSYLPPDIKYSMPPFWTATSSSGLPINQTWSDIQLLTSKRTGSVPAIINVEADQQSNKKGGLDWRTLWLHDYLHQLWDAQNEVSRLPLISVVEGTTEHVFWNQELRMDRNGAQWRGDGWKWWTDHCGWGDADEVVRLPSKRDLRA